MDNNLLPFSEKYRPRVVDDLVLDDVIMSILRDIIEKKDIPNIILTGTSGIGKTSTINIIASSIYKKYINDMTIELNASDERGIKSVNEIIKNFCKKKVDFENSSLTHKLIILDEADNITPKAQRLINLTMEKYPNTRFAFTCNDSSKIIEAIQSRCVILRFPKPPLIKYLQKIKYICNLENINYDINALEYLYDKNNRDLRQTINMLELINNAVDYVNIPNINVVCNIPSQDNFIILYNSIIHKNIKNILITINKFKNDGYFSLDILLYFIQFIKNYDSDDINEDIKNNFIAILSDKAFSMSKSSGNYIDLSSAFLSLL
jgi:replication factor C subunit 2/4